MTYFEISIIKRLSKEGIVYEGFNKVKNVASCFLIVGITLVILSICFSSHPFGDPFFPKTPLIALFVPGVSLISTSIMLFFIGFRPQITKVSAKLHSENLDYAGENISEAAVKTVDVASPAIDKTIRVVKNAIKKETIFCKHCNASIDDDSKFCKNCGKNIN